MAPVATLPIINNESIKAFPLCLPHVDRQRELARSWDESLRWTGRTTLELRRSTTLLSEYKQSLITAAVTGDLDVTSAGSGIPG